MAEIMKVQQLFELTVELGNVRILTNLDETKLSKCQ